MAKEERMRKSYILDIANTNDAASNYIDRGWHPVPIPKGEKGPSIAVGKKVDTSPTTSRPRRTSASFSI
jgi:hypothetical protein